MTLKQTDATPACGTSRRRRADESAEADTTRLRVRVTNQPDSTKEQFTLSWADAHGPVPALRR